MFLSFVDLLILYLFIQPVRRSCWCNPHVPCRHLRARRHGTRRRVGKVWALEGACLEWRPGDQRRLRRPQCSIVAVWQINSHLAIYLLLGIVNDWGMVDGTAFTLI